MRKTKVVCTVGPACDEVEILMQMIEAGMDVARFNMSHGAGNALKERIQKVKEAAERCGKTVALLIDTKGPEVRVGTFEGGSVVLENNQLFRLHREAGKGDETGTSLSYPRLIDYLKALPEDRSRGMQILLDDGKILAEITNVEDDFIECVVKQGGRLSSRKSINLPDFNIPMPYISSADREDIEFGLKQGVDYIAASFVRSPDDVIKLRDFVDSLGYEDVEIISKIENQQGVDHIDQIIDVSDGIMVARGDMGVEIPFIQLPAIQKSIIRKCVSKGKYVITATQMLESMTASPRPTRAEISDVANAVFDGTSAVMLSGESAAGKFPVESVRAIASICEEAEANQEYLDLQEFVTASASRAGSIRETLCQAAKTAAENVGASAIIVESMTGRSARIMTHYRPSIPIIAVVIDEKVCRKLSLNWGIRAILGEEKEPGSEVTKQAIEKALETGIVKKGDYVVILSSNYVLPTSNTDTLNIRIV